MVTNARCVVGCGAEAVALAPPGCVICPPTAGGGGSVPAPDWVPEGASMFIDILGQKTWDGTAEGSNLTSMLGEDPLATADVWTNGYDASGLNASGYSTQASGLGVVALIGSAKAALTNGAVIVMQFLNEGSNISSFGMFAPTGGGTSLNALELAGESGEMQLQTNGARLVITPSGYLNSGMGAINKMAVKMVHVGDTANSELWASGNGNPEIGQDGLVDAEGAWSFGYGLFETGLNRIQSIAIYDNANYTHADLPALSAL
jgi:hypothetical protein